MIRFEAVCKWFGSNQILHNISLELQRGGLVGLVGANGAGKSTLLSVAGRLITPESGSVEVDGMNPFTVDQRKLARRLSILKQENSLTARLTVGELVAFGRLPHGKGRLQEIDRQKVMESIEYMDLTGLVGRRLDELSGGQKQRAFIAMILCQDTDYVLLDEPLNNLDLRHSVQVMRLIRGLVDDFEKTVVVVLHDINMAACYADRIVAMKAGRIVADSVPSELITSERLQEIYDIQLPVTYANGHPHVLYPRV